MTASIKLLQFSELNAHGVPYRRTHLATLEGQKKFPQRVRLGDNRIAWVEAEVDAYVRGRVEARPS